MVLFGTIGYLACSAGVNLCVVQHPHFNPVIQISLIVALGLALLTAVDGFFCLLGITRSDDFAGRPFLAACAASIAYALTYGPYVFINTWWHDDWSYFEWEPSFSLDLLTKVLNDHISPLLNLIIWTATRLFGVDYTGIALLQHGVFIVLLLAVAHMFCSASRNIGLVILFLAAYASWPSHEDSRTWLGGGFWLSASAALLMVYLLHARTRLAAETKPTPSACVISLMLACMTVFISSQTMIPVVFLVVFVAATVAVSADRPATMRRAAVLAGLSLIPTACIFVGRVIYVQRAGFDLSGLINGDLIRNAIIFFNVKVLLLPLDYLAENSRLLPVALFVMLFLAPIVLALKVQWDEYRRKHLFARDQWASGVGLVLLGCALLAELFIQIGAARSWGSGSVLASYYATLPLLAVWIAEFGAVATLLPRIAHLLPDRGWRHAGALMVGFAIALQVALSFAIVHDRLPLSRRIEANEQQRQFLASLGAAACSLADRYPGKTIAWRTTYNLSTDCPRCASIIGPPGFLRDGRDILQAVAPLAARQVCKEADADRIDGGSSRINPDVRTDGGESEALQEFYRSYFTAR